MTNVSTNVSTILSTNLTNASENTMNTVTNTMMTESAKSSAMAQVLFSKGLTARQALALSVCFMNKEAMLGHAMWEVNMEVAMDTVIVNDNLIDPIVSWYETLCSANLITADGEAGTYLIQLNDLKDKSYPTPVGEPLVRKRPLVSSMEKASSLTKKAIDVLQGNVYNVDEYMLSIATSIYTNKDFVCEDAYVVAACKLLVEQGNLPVTSEFFCDSRARLYQGDFHGPNGQASDMARSFMELHGVAFDYDILKAKQVILAEMKDMTKDLRACSNQRKQLGDAGFIKFHEQNGTSVKAWSFVKAARIMAALQAGERPYIGMAFGLDAKCSGPQISSMLVGDIKIAAACGLTLSEEVIADAYELTIAAFGKYSKMFSRNLIKPSYMGIFYGQGFMTFANPDNFVGEKGHDPELLVALDLMNGEVKDWMLEIAKSAGVEPQRMANAYYFHKIVEKSFGEVSKLRELMIKAHYFKDEDGELVMRTSKPTKHAMPDGQVVAVKYMKRVDIDDTIIGYGHITPNVTVEIGMTKFKFKKMSFNTKTHDLQNYGRTGFVNLIQATDALLARHIIVELDKLDVQHVVSVHDCFRVNIHDMIDGKLHSAIKSAYLNVFANTHTDILGDYFKGVRDAGSDEVGYSQIITTRRGTKLNRATLAGMDIKQVIMGLKNDLDGTGSAIYFAK